MTSPIRVLIVDDEPIARDGARSLVQRDAELHVVGACANGREAIRVLRATPVDVLLLDVKMPKISGFDVLAEIGAVNAPVVVFMTAYDTFAIKAFEARAVDYLLKPYTDERFAEALQRAKERVVQRSAVQSRDALQRVLALLRGESPASPTPSYLTQIVVRSNGVVWYLPVGEIDWIEAADYYACLHANGRRVLTRESLAHLEDTLDPKEFIRVHRSAIVRLSRVRAVRVDSVGRTFVVLAGEQRVPLSRSYRPALEAALETR